MNLRLKSLYLELKKKKLDGLILSSCANISYLLGFLSRDSYLLVSKKKNIYFTDSRYTDEVSPFLKKDNVLLIKTGGSALESIGTACKDLKLKKIGFEEDTLSCLRYKRLRSALGSRVRLKPSGSLVEGQRQIKDASEIGEIKEALRITGLALKFAKKIIRPGKREIEIAGELERFIRYQGADNAAFEIIVASGPNSSYPHHAPGKRKVRINEPVLLDIGVEYQGYKYDLTRVYFLGKINFLVRKVWDIVAKAQDLAIKEIRPGVKIAEIDRVSRDFIARQGYGRNFGHNLGHGVGLQIHEAPSISPGASGVLKPGMVFTLEPAVYLTGRFGIRIEDMVLVTKKGCEVLSGFINQ